MKDLKIHTVSLSDFLHEAGFSGTDAMRTEDNQKRERLKVLNEIIGLPFDRPTQFEASELVDPISDKLGAYIAEHGNELCALRLNPKNHVVQKMRNRGKTIREALDWFQSLDIDPAQYSADFVPHSYDQRWSTIFVVNKNGIFGEIISGVHSQLTQGYHDERPPMTFAYDYESWIIEPEDSKARLHLEEIFKHLYIPDSSKQNEVHKKLNGTFSNNYLEGYFETVFSEAAGLWFIDYNRVLGELYAEYRLKKKRQPTASVSGHPAGGGAVTGTVHVVSSIEGVRLSENAILVCEMTTPDHVQLMKQASAIVTEFGGVLCHAAIVARELKKPCIVGVTGVTQKLTTGDRVLVDGDTGVIERVA